MGRLRASVKSRKLAKLGGKSSGSYETKNRRESLGALTAQAMQQVKAGVPAIYLRPARSRPTAIDSLEVPDQSLCDIPSPVVSES